MIFRVGDPLTGVNGKFARFNYLLFSRTCPQGNILPSRGGGLQQLQELSKNLLVADPLHRRLTAQHINFFSRPVLGGNPEDAS